MWSDLDVPHSSQTRLEWATLQLFVSDERDSGFPSARAQESPGGKSPRWPIQAVFWLEWGTSKPLHTFGSSVYDKSKGGGFPLWLLVASLAAPRIRGTRLSSHSAQPQNSPGLNRDPGCSHLFLSQLKPLVNLVPIDRSPPGGEVVRTLVLILQVIRVLPDIIPQNGELPLRNWIVLVRRSHYL